MKFKRNFFSILIFISTFIVLLISNYKVVKANNDDLKVEYSAFFSKDFLISGWSDYVEDNTKLWYKGNYPSAIKIGLVNQPSGMSGTVIYEVNLSGSGWLNSVENRAEIGDASLGAKPLEAIKIRLNGDLAENYDIYYSVLQDGEFTPWVKNGEVAGEFGVGKHILGLRVSITKKDTTEPSESKVIASNKRYEADKNKIDITNIDTSKKFLALTYDDGPSAKVTPRVLDILKANNAKATFFIIGLHTGGNEKILKRAYEEGHDIGNHTYRHKDLSKQTLADRKDAIVSTSEIIKNVTGKAPYLLRPPYGAYNRETLDMISSLSLSNIMWSVDTLDWKHKNSKKIIDHVLENAKDGDIILMHDIYTSTADATEVLVPELIKRGFTLVTISELAAIKGVDLQVGHTYNSFRNKKSKRLNKS